MKSICLLGGSGSIGTQVLDIIRENPNKYQLISFSFGHNINKAIEIINEFLPKLVCTPFNKEYLEIKKYLSKHNFKITVSKNLLDVVNCECEQQMVINALVGSVGLKPTLTAIQNNKILLLANKESLVMAGELVQNELKQSQSILIPIDSEHSALYQLMNKVNYHDVDKLFITASGGALRDYPVEKLTSVTPQDALKHPNWQMGSKITIDSATMMNKVFELFEAKYLFNTSNVDALIDRSSKVHAAILLKNGKVLYHTSDNDMHLPIKYAMEFPDLNDYNQTDKMIDSYELFIKAFDLKPIEQFKYPAIKYRQMLRETPKFLGTIITICNDYLVDLFLNNQIIYTDIFRITDKIVNQYQYKFEHLDFNLKNIEHVYKVILKEVKKCSGKLS